MGLPLFGDGEGYLETGDYLETGGDDNLIVDPAGAIFVEAAAALKKLDENRDRFDTLRTALAEIFNTPAGKLPNPLQLGKKLGHQRRRVVAGKCFEQTTCRNTSRWSVVNVDATESHPSR